MKRFSHLIAIVTATLLATQACLLASVGFETAVASSEGTHQGGPVPMGPTVNPWPMNRYNATHSGSTSTAAPTSSAILWSNSTDLNAWSSPAIADGKVFIGAGETMFAFDHDTGRLLWSRPTNSSVPGGYGLTSSPAYAGGMLYYGGDQVYGVDANTGAIRWSVDTGNGPYGDGTPTVSGNRVYIGGLDRRLYAIERTTGTVIWTFQTGSGGPNNYGLFSAPAVWGGYVYLAACDGYVYQINETQLSPVATYYHRYATGNAMYGSPVIYGGNVIIGNGYYTAPGGGNKLFALRASDLTLVWRFPTTATPVSFFSSAAIANDTIFIGSIEGNLYAINPSNGVERWRWNIGQSWSAPGIASGELFIGNKAGNIYAFPASQTRPVNYDWMYASGGDVSSSPAISDGRMCVGSNGGGGQVICFGQSSGPTDNPPTVRAWEPGGTPGQTYTVGQSVQVRWRATDDYPMPANNVNISYGSGSAWTDVIRNTANDGLHSWDTASVAPGTYWISVSAYDSAGQSSYGIGNYSFQIDIAPDLPPSVSAWEPGGTPGQTFVVSSMVQTQWLATDAFPMPINNVNVSYGSGSTWTDIVRNAANIGFYTWDTTGVPLGMYYINVSAYDAKGQSSYDLGNFTFEIVSANKPPSIAIGQPVGGESWTGGSPHMITWTASDIEDPVANLKVWVNYSLTGSAPFDHQVSGLQDIPADPAMFSWNVPLENSVTVVLNATVVDTAGGRDFDLSGVFEIDSIAPAVQSTNPPSGGTGVPTSANVLTSFSEPMNTASSELSFTLSDTATWTPVPGTFSWAGPMMIFNPTGSLSPSTQYSANITTSARDDSGPGNNLATAYAWTFTTASSADLTPPAIISATALPDPQEIPLPVTISALVQDDVAVGEAWVTVFEPNMLQTNFSMTLDGVSGRYFRLFICQLIGLHGFEIAAADTSGNWNYSAGQFTCRDTTPPVITNLRVVPDPAEVMSPANISAIITDNLQVAGAWLNITMPDSTTTNNSMTSGARYFWVGDPPQVGTYDLRVWATDTAGNWGTAAIQREVVDSSPPIIAGAVATPNPVEIMLSTNITARVTDNFALNAVFVNVTSPDSTWDNSTMDGLGPFYLNAATSRLGLHSFVVSALDIGGNWARATGSFDVVDTTPPQIVHTPVASRPTGSDLNLTATITDNHAVNTVTLNYTDVDGVVRNMTATVGGQHYYVVQGQAHSGTLTYFFWADDVTGNAARTQTYSVAIVGSRPRPPILLAVASEGFGALRLSWSAPAANEDGSALTDLAGYNVYRMALPGGSRTPANTNGLVQGTSLLDTGLLDGTTYYYVVRAVNSNSVNSDDSNPLSGTTLTTTPPTDNTPLILAIVLIMIIVVVAVVFLLIRKRKKDEEDEDGANPEGAPAAPRQNQEMQPPRQEK